MSLYNSQGFFRFSRSAKSFVVPDGSIAAVILATHFPPTGGAASLRWLHLANELCRSGLAVHVVTAKATRADPTDSALELVIDEGVAVSRLGDGYRSAVDFVVAGIVRVLWRLGFRGAVGKVQPAIYRWIALPDVSWWWGVRAVRRTLSISSGEDKVVVVGSVGPPACLMAGAVCKLLLGGRLLFVAEYRDEWSTYGVFASRLHRRLARTVERLCVRRADAVVCVSAEQLDRVKQGVGSDCAHQDYCVIPNGFAESDICDSRSRTGVLADDLSTSAKFRVAHVGMLYGTRSPKDLLVAVDSLIQAGMVDSEQIELTLAGPAHHPASVEYAHVSWLRLMDHISHAAAVDLMREQHLLVVIVHDDAPQSLPVKLFEAVAARRPVLAITPVPSAVARVLSDVSSSFVVSSGDLSGVVSAILECYSDWSDGKWRAPDVPLWWSEYSRARHAISYELLFRRLLGGDV